MIEENIVISDATSETGLELAHAFRRAGEELYLVGGAVRDQLLGRRDYDLDFATSALPPRTIEILEGLEVDAVYRVGEKFGTIGALCGVRRLEITTYRSAEIYAPGSRKPEVDFGRSVHDDLRRRDFTINAMAREPISGELIDPFDGRSDLRQRQIHAVDDPDARFAEDPLRLLRAVRFAAALGFTIEVDTWTAMKNNAGRLRTISRERVRDEYSRILTGPGPVQGLTLSRDSCLLAETVPPLLELTRMSDHGPGHPLSLWDHTMRVVEGVPSQLDVRWAAILHDIAKPATRQITPDGRTRFFHHEVLGVELARNTLRELHYPNDFVADVVNLVETHMQLHAYSAEWSDGAVRRLLLRLGSLWPQALALARADAAGHATTGGSANAPRLDRLERRVADLGADPTDSFRSPLSGDRLMERYDRPPGAWIRQIKDALRDEVLDGRLEPDNLEAAWRLADRIARSQQGPW